MARTYQGYLLIADITGYTQYLSTSELEHAQETLAALLELLVANMRPPLVISRLAGDAVLSYGLQDNFYHGQTFLETIETTYVTFRTAIERMVLNNTCRCAACANIGGLDLKFFVHYGQFGLQRIDNHDELVGSDVNLIHRLLKNRVTEKTGLRAYALYTDAAIRQLGLEDLCRHMTPHTEAYEHLGETTVWIQDMNAVWEKRRASTRVALPDDQVLLRVDTEIAMPPERVWDYLSRPEFRVIVAGADQMEVTNRVHGRVGTGSVYQCYHGDKLIPETVLEWEPFEHILTRDLLPVPIPNVYALIEFQLSPTPGGTRLVQSIGKATGPLLGRLLANAVIRRSVDRGRKDIAAFKAAVEQDLAERIAAEAAVAAEAEGA